MDKNIQNVIRLQSCQRTEYWYNKVIAEYNKMDISKTGDTRLNAIIKQYDNALFNLINLEVGGVLINGVFKKVY